MTYKDIITQVSNETGMSKTFIDKTYRAYWRAIREYISSLPLKDDLTEEEFSKLRPNINIPSLGKLCVTKDKYYKTKKMHKDKLERIEKYVAHKENKATV